jgi:pyruvate dehydrogenase E1 component
VNRSPSDPDTLETRDWLDSLDDLLQRRGPERTRELLARLQIHAQKSRVELPVTSRTPYVNTIPLARQPAYPGDRAIERRIKSLIRWNAMAMVVRANSGGGGLGGHISSFASAATLYEVAFNHFFRGPDHDCGGDLVFFQGHSAPGIYARAFLEGRFDATQLENFRREVDGHGLSSYPHPWLMPEFWSLPTVSMGLGPIMAIYQARFMRYLSDRGLTPYRDAKVWAFLGDGETDEPETLGAISLAAREKLDNLIFVVNCNLQRLDGPVRGNGSIVQELEANFRGSGWNVIKVLWGGDWDFLLENDHDGKLAQRMGEVCDGEYQKYAVEGGAYIRKHFFGADPELAARVAHLSDEQLWKMRLGGHDPDKVYAAYKAAIDTRDRPTVVLARTIKGYGLGEAGEGKNITHQQKKLNEEEMLLFRDRFQIPLDDDTVRSMPFHRPAPESREASYLLERRRALGGFMPQRRVHPYQLELPPQSTYQELFAGTQGREVSTTMAFVRLLGKLMKDPELGRFIVPIIPDEARTFGMEAMFRQFGIYSHVGQRYEPVDADQIAYYREAVDGQILEEGITEAGSLSSFAAAASAYALHRVPTIPFFIFYSMFGFQRVADLIWAASDMRSRGFLLGATAGRSTLNGEGLQHQDGHSLLFASVVPNLLSYDPAFAFELAVIIREGLRRMHENSEDLIYYLTLYNENAAQLPMPEGVEDGILRGLYLLKPSELSAPRTRVELLTAGSMVNTGLRAQALLAERFGVAADLWSAPSFTELRREALSCERAALLSGDAPKPYVQRVLEGARSQVFVACTDWIKAIPDGIARWIPGEYVVLGTDGFGRSDTREALRDFFEIDERWMTLAALGGLHRRGLYSAAELDAARKDLGIATEKRDPSRT